MGSFDDLAGLPCTRDAATGSITVSYAADGTATLRCVATAVSVDDVSAAESSGVVTFTLTLTDAATAPASVRATTGGPGSAQAGTDYTAVDTIVQFAEGATSATVEVPVTDDTVVEGDETFTLTLSEPTGLALGRSTAVGTIGNDDCSDDAYEQNDTSATARSFGTLGQSSVTIAARLCPGDPDHFTVTSGPPTFSGTRTLDFVFDASTPIVVEVTGGGGGGSRSGTTGSFSVTVSASSTVWIRVTPAAAPPSHGTPYTIRVTQR